jgi:hypothetical protein
MKCDGEQNCRTGETSQSCTTIMPDDAPTSCWPYSVSNANPCAATFPASAGPFDVTTDTTINTLSPTIGVYDSVAGILTIHVDRFSLAMGKTLTFTGPAPIIIVSEAEATVNGFINVQAAIIGIMPPCSTQNGQDGLLRCGNGGGGGGYGAAGGNGGTAAVGGLAMGGAPNGDATLVPLRGGCSGGGGGNSGQPSGSGGAGGGALQISARTDVRVSGLITANGAGGLGGGSSTCTSSPCSSGGGGGGSGGSILLEGMTLEVTSTGSLCAVGGAGGNGGAGGSVNAGEPGSAGVACVGGTPGATGIAGGRGGDANAPQPGMSTTTAGASGGGGGGSVGRIHLRSIMSAPKVDGFTVP